jgi:hypothetical protein
MKNFSREPMNCPPKTGIWRAKKGELNPHKSFLHYFAMAKICRMIIRKNKDGN